MEIAAESRFGVGQAQHWPAETRSAYRAVIIKAGEKDMASLSWEELRII
jgi:hypothetical protein